MDQEMIKEHEADGGNKWTVLTTVADEQWGPSGVFTEICAVQFVRKQPEQ